MADNLISDGTTITLAAGTARTAGQLYQVASGAQSIVGVALNTTTTTETDVLKLYGEWDLTKTAAASSSFTVGDPVYATTGAGALVGLNSTTTSDIFVGTASETVTTTATSVKVILNIGQKIA